MALYQAERLRNVLVGVRYVYVFKTRSGEPCKDIFDEFSALGTVACTVLSLAWGWGMEDGGGNNVFKEVGGVRNSRGIESDIAYLFTWDQASMGTSVNYSTDHLC